MCKQEQHIPSDFVFARMIDINLPISDEKIVLWRKLSRHTSDEMSLFANSQQLAIGQQGQSVALTSIGAMSHDHTQSL